MLTAGVFSSASSTPPRNLWSASTFWCRYRVPLCSWSLSRSGHWQREVRADDQQQWWRPRDGYGAVRDSASASAEEIEEFNCRSLAKCAEVPEEWNSDWNLKTQVEGKVIPKAEQHDGFADTISTSASEAAPCCTRGGSSRRDFPRRTLTWSWSTTPRTPSRVYCPQGGENEGEDRPREDWRVIFSAGGQENVE